MRRGRRVRGPLLHIAHRPNDLEEARVGFSVSRRVGSAVIRNRVKRRLRELIARHHLAGGRDVVIVAQPGTAHATFAEIGDDLERQLDSAGLELPKSTPNTANSHHTPTTPLSEAPAEAPAAAESRTPAGPRPGLPARIVLAVIRGYQRLISPSQPAACRYEPTCSRYAVTAVERHGAARGSWLALRRLLRCRPGREGGYDPVPEPHRQGGDA